MKVKHLKTKTTIELSAEELENYRIICRRVRKL
jgi:hypothetical protein